MHSALGGVWILDRVVEGGRDVRDPRWTCTVAFDGGSTFSVASTTIIEKRTTGPSGEATRAVQQDIRIVGAYSVADGKLAVTLERPPADDQREFIRNNFGSLDERNTFRPKVSVESGLMLGNEVSGRELYFNRHKKTVRP